MTAQGNALPLGDARWSWPIDRTSYDCSPELTTSERQALALVAERSGGPGNNGGQPRLDAHVLHRLFTPLIDICQLIQGRYTNGTNQKRQANCFLGLE